MLNTAIDWLNRDWPPEVLARIQLMGLCLLLVIFVWVVLDPDVPAGRGPG